MAEKTFKRYELKFLLSEEQYTEISDLIKRYMKQDLHCGQTGSYTIYNLYFDTPGDDIIINSLAKPFYKEKLRMRCYRLPETPEDIVFLELKKKIGGVVSKRRAVLTYGQALAFINNKTFPNAQSYTDCQVLNEIAEFLNRYPARPKVFISYERTAYYGCDDPSFRVTFDRNILTRRDRVHFSDGDFGSELLKDGCRLMEVKTSGSIPLWLSAKFSALQIYKTSFSKYGEEYKQHCRQKTNIINAQRRQRDIASVLKKAI